MLIRNPCRCLGPQLDSWIAGWLNGCLNIWMSPYKLFELHHGSFKNFYKEYKFIMDTCGQYQFPGGSFGMKKTQIKKTFFKFHHFWPFSKLLAFLLPFFQIVGHFSTL